MLLQLDREKLQERATRSTRFFDDPWYDARSAHTVPYAMYTTGIAWREDKVERAHAAPGTTSRSRSAKGKIFMLDDFQEGIGQANLLNGFDLNATDPAELAQTKDDARAPEGVPARLLHQRRAAAAQRHRVDPPRVERRHRQHAQPGQEDPENFKFETCKEGIPVGSDCMAIPANAQVARAPRCCSSTGSSNPEHASQNMPVLRLPDADRGLRGRRSPSSPPTTRRSRSRRTTSRTAASSRSSRRPGSKAWDRVWTEVKA